MTGEELVFIRVPYETRITISHVITRTQPPRVNLSFTIAPRDRRIRDALGHYLKSLGGIMVNVLPREVPGGQNPSGRRFWPRDLPRHNINHDTSKAFS